MRAPGIVASILALLASSASAQLSNPDFDSDLSGWFLTQDPPYATVSWDGSTGSPVLGSALVNYFGYEVDLVGSLIACAGSASVGQSWFASARMWAAARSVDTCGVGIFFHACPDCSCASIGGSGFSHIYDTGDWTTASVVETAPGGTQSVSVALYGYFPGAPAVAEPHPDGLPIAYCRFDSAKLLDRPIYQDGFEFNPEDWTVVQPQTCSGLCFLGGTPDDSCYCDSICLDEDDCCLDACSTCGQCNPSCAGHCEPGGTPDDSCYCDALCLEVGDCCNDACEVCGEC